MSNENSGGGDSGSIVAIVAIVILAGLAVLFFMYGLPMIQKNNAPQPGTTIEVKIPGAIPPATTPEPAQ